MPRFFLPQSECPAGSRPEKLILSGDTAFHLSRVLRAKTGDEVTLFSSDSTEFNAVIEDIYRENGEEKVLVAIRSFSENKTESPVRVKVYQGLPKGKKADTVIQKCTELGAAEIVFVNMDRCVPSIEGAQKKQERFQKIALEAAQQCGRGVVPAVRNLSDTEACLREMTRCDLYFACFESERDLSLKTVLSREAKSVAFLIGPEGGISEREKALFVKYGVPTVTLGNRILRTETAPLAVLSMILYEKEL